jgi:hypothetical protein
MRIKIIVLGVLEIFCILMLIHFLGKPFTIKTAKAGGRFQQAPTEENRLRLEQARKEDKEYYFVMRVTFGLAVALVASQLGRAVLEMKKQRSAVSNGG